MKVHFATSTSKLDKYKDNYLAICDHIKDMGHIITRDWIDEAIKYYNQDKQEIDREEIYNKVIESIISSDAIVIEGTVSSFSVGHQLTLALDKNKPVLFLIYKNGHEEGHFKNSFVDGINSSLLNITKYDMENLKNILSDFFKKYKSGTSVKFNLVLTQEIDSYLNWASFTYGMNKSEFVRSVVQKHIEEEDDRYKKYLKDLSKRGVDEDN